MASWRSCPGRAAAAYFQVRIGTLPVMKFSAGYAFQWLFLAGAFTFVCTSIISVELSPENVAVFVLSLTAGFLAGFLALFAPGGVGVREGVGAAILASVVSLEEALLLMLLFRVWVVAAELIAGAMVFYAGKESKERALTESKAIKVCHVVSYRAPAYIRTRNLRAALHRIDGCEVFDATNTRRGFSRYLETIWKTLRIRMRHKPDVYVLGFRGHEIFWVIRLIALGKPLIFDAFMSPSDALLSEGKAGVPRQDCRRPGLSV